MFNRHLFKRYSVTGIVYLLYCLIRTKLTFKHARLIRYPFDLRGRNYINVGSNFTAGVGCRFEVWELDKIQKNQVLINIGENVQVNDYVHITATCSVIIEDNVLIASRVYISDSNHGNYGDDNIHDSPLSLPNERSINSKPVHIGNGVWLGEGVCILPGVTIGEGSIVGANAVVTKSLPPYSISVGIPARVIKKYNFQLNKWEKV